MKTIIFWWAICSLLLISSNTYSQTSNNQKVVGYVRPQKVTVNTPIEYCKVTHIIIAFANPDESGNLSALDFSGIVTDALAQNPNIKVLVALAGGGLSDTVKQYWSDLIDIPENRPAFIEKIVDYVLLHNLDGIDLDLEGSVITTGFSDFAMELKTALSAENKLLTAAFPAWVSSNVSDDAVAVFDWINVMAYDQTGAWSSEPGQHSSYDFAVNSLNYWKNNRGVSGDRLALGVPFYGVDFTDHPNSVNHLSYKQIVDMDAANADIDNIGLIYHNGRPTIRDKVTLASNEASGTMIWDLPMDTFNEYSLLSTIHDKYTDLGILTTGLCGNEAVLSLTDVSHKNQIGISPNPSSDYITISSLDKEQFYVIYNLLGQEVLSGNVSNELNTIDITNLYHGLYYLKLNTSSKAIKFIKK